MKTSVKISLIIIFLAAGNNIRAQTDTAQLNINNINATVAADGVLFYDGYNSSSGYETPINSGKQAIKSAGLWIGGLDTNGLLHTAAMTYRNGTDFFPGPLDTLNASSNSCSTSAYNYVWELNRSEVDTFLNSAFASSDINSWPGNGNISQNHGHYLAPYTDVDGDGVYNPVNGDYPTLKGDQMLFWIMNDNCGAHTETGGLPFGVEAHCSAYAYAGGTASDSLITLSNTSFYHFKLINRSANQYDSVYISFWVDPELGNGNADITLSNVHLKSGLVVNGSPTDSIYGNTGVALSIAQLKGPLANANDSINNDMDSLYSGGIALGANIDETGEECLFSGFMYYNAGITTLLGSPEPVNQYHYYNYIKNYWNDSTHLTYGGTGYLATTTPAKFAFPGYSDPGGYGTNFTPQPTTWHSLYLPYGGIVAQPSNQKILISAGPFTMQPGEVNEVEYAIIFHMDTSSSWTYQSLYAKAVAQTEIIQSLYKLQNPVSTSSSAATTEKKEIRVYPDPSSDFISFQGAIKNSTVSIYDVAGKIIFTKKISGNEPINISSLSAGIYFVQLNDGNNIYSSRFIKN